MIQTQKCTNSTGYSEMPDVFPAVTLHHSELRAGGRNNPLLIGKLHGEESISIGVKSFVYRLGTKVETENFAP